MKNKIINLAIVGMLFAGLLGTSPVQAQTFNNQQSALLASVSHVADSFTKLLASVVNVFTNQAGESVQQAATAQKAKGIVDTIQVQIDALKTIVDENKGTGAGSSISQQAQVIGPAVKQLTQTLRPGDTGQDVTTLQEHLSSKPDVYPEQLVTGFYGKLTTQAVSKFQESVGLESVGVVGPKTLKIINQELTEEADSNIEAGSNITAPPILSLSEYTIALLNIANDLKHAPATQKQAVAKRLGEYTKGRKDLVLQTIAKNPDAVLQNVFPSSQLANVPVDIQNLIEQKRQVRGKFEWIHIHLGDFDSGTIKDEFYVTDSSGKRYGVHLNGYPEALTDDEVTIDGVVLEDQIATTESSIRIISSPNRKVSDSGSPSILRKIANFFHITKAEAQTTTIQKKAAVIMFNWQNDTRTVYTQDAARSVYFTSATSLNSYYKENSFDKLEFVGKNRPDGDVFGPVTLPYDKVNCPYSTWSSDAEKILTAQGVDLTGYNIKTYIFPSASCGWSGLAYLGGDPARSWINGGSVGTMTHEVGHNLGAWHAGYWTCTENGVRVSISSGNTNCVLLEYGDFYDVMGSSGGIRHMNNAHKSKGSFSLKWLEPQNIVTIDRNVSPDSIYTIAPIEQASTGIQALRIPRLISGTGTVSDYYYLEFRQPIGFDSGISSSVTNGVSIRLAPKSLSGSGGGSDTVFLDATPETSSRDALPVGRTLTDPYTAINITTLSVVPGGAQVRVSFGPLPCVRTNPTLTLSPTSASLFSGQSASFNYTLTNNDTVSCSSSDFSISPTLPTGFTQSPSPISYYTLLPGASVSGSLIISTPTDATPNSYSVTETAQNTSTSTIYKTTAALTMTVLPPDTIPPTVTITSPADGATVSKGNVQIAASASDASGIAEIRILVDGGLIKTCYNTTSCSGSVNAGKLTAGAHTITVQATDKGGPVANVNSASVTIIKK